MVVESSGTPVLSQETCLSMPAFRARLRRKFEIPRQRGIFFSQSVLTKRSRILYFIQFAPKKACPQTKIHERGSRCSIFQTRCRYSHTSACSSFFSSVSRRSVTWLTRKGRRNGGGAGTDVQKSKSLIRTSSMPRPPSRSYRSRLGQSMDIPSSNRRLQAKAHTFRQRPYGPSSRIGPSPG